MKIRIRQLSTEESRKVGGDYYTHQAEIVDIPAGVTTSKVVGCSRADVAFNVLRANVRILIESGVIQVEDA